jgi:MFS family permease
MVGPLIGRLVLDTYDYGALFQLAGVAVAAALVPSLMLHRYGRPIVAQREEVEFRASSMLQVVKEVATYPVVSTVLLYYAVIFGVVLTVYPAYMREASLTDQDIETLFFVFGLSRFATLYFVGKLARYGTIALAMAVAATAVGMLISFAFASLLTFAVALVLVGLAISIFYPVTLNIVTRNMPGEKMGERLGVYEALFGVGWTIGPIAVGLSSDAFGSSSPYLALFIIGSALSGAIALSAARKGNSF